MTRINLTERQVKREARLDLVLKDIQIAGVVKCLGSKITSDSLRKPYLPMIKIECIACPTGGLCKAIRWAVARL